VRQAGHRDFGRRARCLVLQSGSPRARRVAAQGSGVWDASAEPSRNGNALRKRTGSSCVYLFGVPQAPTGEEPSDGDGR
jgi:hypothetical protein